MSPGAPLPPLRRNDELIPSCSLNVLEKAWMSWYQYWGNPIIATGIMSFVMHEVSRELDGALEGS